MMCPKHLATIGLAFIAFAVLPTAFWTSITYWVVNPTAAKVVGLSFFIAGLYTCYRGGSNNYRWFNQRCNKHKPNHN